MICPNCKMKMILVSVEGRLVTYKCPHCGYRMQYEDPDLRGCILEDPRTTTQVCGKEGFR